jgi:O-acetyl-ADP-ribose deacetylase (regulator of RNase III)
LPTHVTRMQAPEHKVEKLVIVCANYSGRATIYEYFYTFKQVEIKKDFQSIDNLDCIIVPCPNAFGKATGLAQTVTSLLGSGFEKQVQQKIIEDYNGEQPKGTAFIIKPLRKEGKEVCKYVCWVALCRSPEDLPKDYAYTGLWAALTTIQLHNKKAKDKQRPIKVVATPCIDLSELNEKMKESCRQMALACKRFFEPSHDPIDADSALKWNESIVINPPTGNPVEKEKELEGLMWSRELGAILPSLTLFRLIRFLLIRRCLLRCITLIRDARSLFGRRG